MQLSNSRLCGSRKNAVFLFLCMFVLVDLMACLLLLFGWDLRHGILAPLISCCLGVGVSVGWWNCCFVFLLSGVTHAYFEWKLPFVDIQLARLAGGRWNTKGRETLLMRVRQ